MFNPFQYMQIVKGKLSSSPVQSLKLEDLEEFLNKKSLSFDRRVIRNFFAFYATGEQIFFNK